jgi:hypothetical protein
MSREQRLSRAEFLSELPWDYLQVWRLEWYPREDVTQWRRLSLRVWMMFTQRRFLIRGAVEWYLPFTYGDATRPRSIAEHQTPEIWGDEDTPVEEFARTSQRTFLQALPPLFEVLERTVGRGHPLVYVQPL